MKNNKPDIPISYRADLIKNEKGKLDFIRNPKGRFWVAEYTSYVNSRKNNIDFLTPKINFMADKQLQKTWFIARLIVGGILAIFLYFVLFGESGSAIDKEFVHDRVRFSNFFDWIGLILFVGGIYFLITGGKPFVKQDIYTKTNSVTPAIVNILAIVLGVIIFWNL